MEPAQEIVHPVPAASSRRVVGVAVVVAIAHGATDAYIAFLHPLLPRIMGRLDLSVTLAATLVMVLSFASSIAQPALGYLADRHGRRWFVAAGPLVAGVFLSLIGIAPGLWTLLLLLTLGGLGSAAFHPPGASMAARVEEGGGSGVRLSFFSFGGSFGYALGPLIAVFLVARVGLEGLWVAMMPALLIAAALAAVLPRGSADRPARQPPPPGRLLGLLAGPLGLLFGISAVAAFVQRVFLTMEPIVVAAAGGSETLGAVGLSLYLGGQASGSLVGGYLTDRMDRRRLLMLLTLLAAPAHFLAFWFPAGSGPALAMAVVAGLLGMSMFPPIVVRAQEIVPAGSAVSSGIVMGLAWAVGSVALLATGALGDLLDPRSAALISMPALLIGTFLASRMSRPTAR